MEGLTYRLTPIANAGVNNDVAYKNITTQFVYGNTDKKGVYLDEENRRHINSIRLAHATLAKSLVAYNKMDSARKVLEKYDQNVLEVECALWHDL